MSIVNSKTFFFPKLYSLKVTELGEQTKKRKGAGAREGKERLWRGGIQVGSKDCTMKSGGGWKQKDVE